MTAEQHPRWADYLASAYKGRDFQVGVALGLAAGAICTIDRVRDDGVTLLLAAGAVCVALLGAVLTALAVFTAFFDGPYRRVLEAAGGVRRGMAPYLVIAVASALGAAAVLFASLTWTVLPEWAQAASFGVTAGLTAWVIAGVVSLIEITIFHAEQRAALMRGVEDAEDVRAARLTRTPR